MDKYFYILQKNDYRSKWQLLMWSALPVFLICYFLAFKKTFNTITAYNKNQLLTRQAGSRQDSLAIYDTKLNAINAWKKQYILDSAVMDAHVLATINIICDELGINFNEYKPLGTSRQNVWTRLVTVEGDFNTILQMIYKLEQVDKICRIASVDFKKAKSSGDKAGELYCTLYIQNVIRQ
ncbi:hypothetical protein [Niabella aquatica]